MHKYFANTLFIGKQVVFLPTCHSTNDIAAKLVPEGKLQEGAIVITNHQTAGKGQRGNTWDTDPGKNLTFSLFLKPNFLAIQSQFFLNIFTSLAIADFLKTYVKQGIAVKWPNDIYINDGKLGGILIENAIRKGNIEYAIVGIGLNINQQHFSTEKATSLAHVCQQEFDLESLLHPLLHYIETRYLQLKVGKYKILLQDYLSKLYWMGEERVFKANERFTGEICGIDEIGRLMIKTKEGIRKFDVKEVSFVQ